ncbi:hypothetical protein QNI16_14725 [Cytophagaceae bacterium YF14B1]|uniref:Uncharacterized protein n=1 Tax=Xanthocytophaga flava TaxID=3048013 RepID=A0AAE3QLX6_9BACT|nr:hypothetical protein [Xanthocytophaga flavus]MDJ1481752.1 hypothetical protein [Xanthocytophaga flavus]
MNKSSKPTLQNQELREFLKRQNKTLFGLHFSESGKKFIADKYGVTTTGLELMITEIRKEGVHE